MSYESLKAAAREAAKGMDQVREAVRLGFEMKRELEVRQKQQQEEQKHWPPRPSENTPEALVEYALRAAKEAMVEAIRLSPMGQPAAWAGARAAVTAYLATIAEAPPPVETSTP